MKYIKQSFKIVVTLLPMTVLIIGLVYREQISDWWRLRSYTPDATIASLASDSGMSGRGQRLFYVYYPTLEDKTGFREKCTGYEQSIVLGCYISRTGLHILNVNDERLAGVEEVTAAHEMLHVGYERLSASKKSELTNLFAEQRNLVTDPRILDTLKQYQSEGADLDNEMHSIFGTEVRDLLPDLEVYYRQYFADRNKVVTLAESYAAAFVERENRVAAYDEQLTSLKANIDRDSELADQLGSQLEAQRIQMESLRSSNPAAFNSRVDSYNYDIRRYNRLIDQLKREIADYNNLVEERNAVALEEQQLIDAIDSRLNPL